MAFPRQLTQAEKEGLVNDLTGGLSQVVDNSAALLFDRPGFVAGDGPLDPLGTAVRELTRYNCRSWARSDQSQNSVRVNRGNADICTPYLDSINELPVGGSLAPPGVGGQCDNVEYRINAERRLFSQSQQQFIWQLGNPFTMRGPITVVNTTGNETCADPENIFARFELRSPNNQTRGLTAACTDTAVNYRNLTFVRVDGQPDGCGSQEPEYTPPTPAPSLPALPPTIPVFLPGVGTVNVNVGFNPSGGITVGLPDLGVEGTVNVGGGGADGGTGGGSGAPPGDVGEPGGAEGTGEGGEAEGEAPDGSILVGLRIDFVDAPRGGNEYRPGVFRGVCYVYMGTDEGLDHDPAGAMMRSGQFVFAEKDNLTRWRVSANRGYNLSVTPYYRQIETEE